MEVADGVEDGVFGFGFVLVFEGVFCGGGFEIEGYREVVFFGDFELTGGNQEVDVVGDLVLYPFDGVEVGGVGVGGLLVMGFPSCSERRWV